MMHTKKNIAVYLLLVVASVTGIFAQNIDKRKLDSLCDVLNTHQKLLGNLLITKNGAVVFDYKFDENGKKGQVTRIGSITKIYTAVMVMQLIEEGKLSMDTKLSEYFPKIDGAENISIYHLLTHQSGIYSFDNDYVLNDPDSWVYKPQSQSQMLKRFYSYKLLFKPGEKTAYSNTGYALLGYILEKIGHSTYNEQLQERICKRLGLTKTYCADTINTAKGESFSYVKENGWVPYMSSNLSAAAAGGAGSILSTPNEIAAFYHAIFQYKLLKKESVDVMTSKRIGFNKDILTDDQFGFGHLGSIDAYYNSATYNPADSICFVFCFNGLSYPFADVFFKTIDIYYNKKVAFPSFVPIEVNIEKMKQFEGKYQLQRGDIIEIRLVENNLHFIWEVNGYGNFALTPIDENVFLYDPKGLTFKFGYNKEKAVDKLTMYQGKQVVRMGKLR